MKSFKSILATLFVIVAFIACTNNASTKEASGTSDTSAAVTSNSGNSTDANRETPEANKKLVQDFIQSLYGDKDSTAIDKYVADDIKEHNPAIQQDGKEALKNALRPFLSNPNIEKTKIDIKQVAADGDLVWLFVRDVAPNKKVFARVDIFRVDNGKIVENWKISEAVSEKSENANSTF